MQSVWVERNLLAATKELIEFGGIGELSLEDELSHSAAKENWNTPVRVLGTRAKNFSTGLHFLQANLSEKRIEALSEIEITTASAKGATNQIEKGRPLCTCWNALP